MTPLQQRVLSFVREYLERHEYGPSYVEIARECGLKSVSQVNGVVNALVLDGYLSRRAAASRSLRPTDKPDPQTKAIVLDDFIARLERKCPAVTSWAMVRQVANEMRAEA